MKININDIKPLADDLMSHCQQKLGFEHPPELFFQEDEQNASNTLGKTAYYVPGEKKVVIYVTGRHGKDILRSLAHELVHHMQNCRGDFNNDDDTSDGYAQNNPHLRNMEAEAYLLGNMIFRDWEDGKKSRNLKENKEVQKMNIDAIKKLVKEQLLQILQEKSQKEVNEEETAEEESKPDFLDLDKDGDKREPMEDAAKDAKGADDEEDKEEVNEAACGKRDDETLEEDWGGSSRPSDRGGYGYQSYDPASQSGAKERCRQKARGKHGPDYWRTYNDCMSRSTYSNFEESNSEETTATIEEQEILQEKDFWSQAQDYAAKECDHLSGDAYGMCFRRKADDHYSYLIKQSQSGDSSHYGSGREHLISFYEENQKVETPEHENALYESRFTQRDTHLFERLMDKWIKHKK